MTTPIEDRSPVSGTVAGALPAKVLTEAEFLIVCPVKRHKAWPSLPPLLHGIVRSGNTLPLLHNLEERPPAREPSNQRIKPSKLRASINFSSPKLFILVLFHSDRNLTYRPEVEKIHPNSFWGWHCPNTVSNKRKLWENYKVYKHRCKNPQQSIKNLTHQYIKRIIQKLKWDFPQVCKVTLALNQSI